MPILIAILVLSFVAGLIARRPATAYAFTGVLAGLANASFVWAVADGEGDDPAWILLLSLAGGAAAFGAAWAATTARRRLDRSGAAVAAR